MLIEIISTVMYYRCIEKKGEKKEDKKKRSLYPIFRPAVNIFDPKETRDMYSI